MVTLSMIASRDKALDRALDSAVRPARAALDKPITGCGDLTMAEVMLTMRPNLRARIPGITLRISNAAAIRLVCSAPIQAAWSHSASCPGGGPALLLTKMSVRGRLPAAPRVPPRC